MLEYETCIDLLNLFNILFVRIWRTKTLLVNINTQKAIEMREEGGTKFSVTRKCLKSNGNVFFNSFVLFLPLRGCFCTLTKNEGFIMHEEKWQRMFLSGLKLFDWSPKSHSCSFYNGKSLGLAFVNRKIIAKMKEWGLVQRKYEKLYSNAQKCRWVWHGTLASCKTRVDCSYFTAFCVTAHFKSGDVHLL